MLLQSCRKMGLEKWLPSFASRTWVGSNNKFHIPDKKVTITSMKPPLLNNF